MPQPPKKPLIAIIGATGTGKSSLAIHLAKYLSPCGGEIINADAMQMYKGLPIITNKIPTTEMEGVPHHLFDFIGLEQPAWTVGGFVAKAMECIEEVRARGKVPILVGGTHYYLQSLLLKSSLVVDGTEEGKGEEWPILDAPTEEIYARLQQVDPEMARRWHPRDRRHVQRSLEIWLRTRRRASEVYREQKREREDGKTPVEGREGKEAGKESDAEKSSGLRYDCLAFWLDAEDDVLRRRLNRRVDTMLSSGLIQEAFSMADLETSLKANNIPIDKSKGIWVSIGYKELQPYITALSRGTLDEKALLRSKEEGIESVKASTRQYAKTQRRWIRNKLCNALTEAGGGESLFLLDCTDLEKWHAVTQQSQDIAEAFVRGEPLPHPSELSQLAKSTLLSNGHASSKREFATRTCEVCDRIMMSEDEWERHLKSRSHHRVLSSQRKHAENETRRLASRECVADPPGID